MINPCKHPNKERRTAHIVFNPKYSEGHWELGKGIQMRASNSIVPTIRWSEPYILSAKVGNLCLTCGEIV